MNPLLVRTLTEIPQIKLDPPELTHHPEWLVTNGLGGYASGTVSGAMARRYHGLLIAAFPAPLGRMLLLNDLNEEIHFPDGRFVQLSTRYGDSAEPTARLIEFRLEMGLPVWRYQIDDWMIEKWLHMPYRQNTVYVTYKPFACPNGIRLKLRPLIQYRGHSDDVDALAAELDRRTRLIASADSKAHSGFPAELVLAADQFIAVPTGRLVDQTRTHASGDEMRTVIAGYHWFTDWGRDTMISLEGLTLVTRRFLEAGWILRNFAKSIRHGLIPNLFPEGSREGLYHTADATLWFFHAIERYVQATGDRWTLGMLLPKLIEIFEAHRRGTLFGIRVDPEDGLLRQGEEGYQLTWMDAKVGDWVVTPRRGKAVEIVALWYNALRLLQKWVDEEKDQALARKIGAWADRAE